MYNNHLELVVVTLRLTIKCENCRKKNFPSLPMTIASFAAKGQNGAYGGSLSWGFRLVWAYGSE